MNLPASPTPLTLTPIGYIRTKLKVKFDAPHQPIDSAEEQNVIELIEGQGYERALSDLSGFDRIWLIWWFNRNTTWRPMVRPPRGGHQRRGVFATRSPHRPNPIGITSVPLLGIKGLKLLIGNCDLLDATPILDIKPYLQTVDAFPEAKSGWLAEVEAGLAVPPSYTLVYEPLAAAQIEWLKETWQIEFMKRASEILERTPSAHRTRRIRRNGENGFRMSCGAWRLYFSVHENRVLIEKVARGFPERILLKEGWEDVPDRDAQIAFSLKWPD